MFLVACGFKSCLITSWFLRWLVTLWYSPELKWFNPHDCLNLQVWCSTLPPFNPPLIFWVQIPQVFPSAIARGPRSLPGSDATGARDATLTAAWAGDDAVAALEGLGQLRLVRHHPRHRRHRHRHRRGDDDDDDELENYTHGISWVWRMWPLTLNEIDAHVENDYEDYDNDYDYDLSIVTVDVQLQNLHLEPISVQLGNAGHVQ